LITKNLENIQSKTISENVQTFYPEAKNKQLFIYLYRSLSQFFFLIYINRNYINSGIICILEDTNEFIIGSRFFRRNISRNIQIKSAILSTENFRILTS